MSNLPQNFITLTFHPQLIFNGYGQTEVYGISGTVQERGHLGTLKPDFEMKIVNPDTEEPLGPYQEGEVRIKGSTMMISYLNKPKSDYFDSEGFGKTGDIGYYDSNGFLHFVDRMKEVIKYCNNHIAPTEIEDILQTHPKVQESLAFGIKDPSVQELLSVVVVPKPGEKVRIPSLDEDFKFEMSTLILYLQIDEEEIKKFVDERVDADFKKVRGQVIMRNELPRNSMGKLLRREMRRWAEEEAKS